MLIIRIITISFFNEMNMAWIVKIKIGIHTSEWRILLTINERGEQGGNYEH